MSGEPPSGTPPGCPTQALARDLARASVLPDLRVPTTAPLPIPPNTSTPFGTELVTGPTITADHYGRMILYSIYTCRLVWESSELLLFGVPLLGALLPVLLLAYLYNFRFPSLDS
jgi:hypothetical protein